MSIVLSALWLGLSAAHAAEGTLLRLGLEPDPTLRPELRDTPVAQIVANPGWSEADQAAIDALRAELAAARPLADEFDGELRIMSGLEGVISDVHVLRDDADRELLYSALVFQGFAVQRYFQDQLATDPAAAPYRAEMGGATTARAWIDAVALEPDRNPNRADIPGDAEMRAFDEARAKVRLAPTATVTALGLPPGAGLVVDGRPASGSKTFVSPGLHRVTIEREGQILVRAEGRLAPGGELSVQVPVMVDDLMALAGPLSGAPEAYALPTEVAELLAGLPQPVVLAVPHDREPLQYELRGASVVRVGELDADAPWLCFSLDIGGGWLYDGDYLLLNQPGAPADDYSVVNAGMPVLGARVWMERGLFGAAAGGDLLMPLGAFHTLPSGEDSVRARPYPYVSAGLPWVQLSLGYLFPWHLGPGLRVRVPLGEHYELAGAAIYGLGRTLERDGDLPAFEAGDARVAWVSVGGSFGLR